MDARTPTPPPIDPIVLIRELDPDAIRQRLSQMKNERDALLVLLRAALAARRQQRKAVPG